MNIKLPEQGTIIDIYTAYGDIDPANNSSANTRAELNAVNRNIPKELAKKSGARWFTEVSKLKEFFTEYQDYKFYEKSIREIITTSLGLKKCTDGSAVSLSYKNIDDLDRVFQSGYEWLLANKNIILEELENKAKQEHMELKREFSSLIDQEVSDETPKVLCINTEVEALDEIIEVSEIPEVPEVLSKTPEISIQNSRQLLK